MLGLVLRLRRSVLGSGSETEEVCARSGSETEEVCARSSSETEEVSARSGSETEGGLCSV